ncbi:MAG: sulfatase-like hydrolase/transferase [Phycisphaerae bacterium]
MSDKRKFNVVFILSDDQGPWAAGCCGTDEIRTPNIDRLASGGVRFTNFFCTSPVCSPARASLMTGRIPSQHGVHDWIYQGNMPPNPQGYLDGQTCYTDILAKAGYTCGLSGKWHLGDSLRPQHGLAHWFTIPKGSSEYLNATVIRDGKTSTCEKYLTDALTDDAVGFIEANKSRPFYLSVNYNAPHQPWTGHPKDIVESYDSCPFKSCPQEPAHPWALPRSRKFLGDREALKGYFAAVTAMDIGIGRIIDRLAALGLRENTLVIFSSDNGYSCGHHGFWHKGNGTFPLNMYENSVKVPAIFSHPGVLPAGKVTGAMVSQYDFMPTLLEYLGMPPSSDKTLPGQSFMPALLCKKDQAKEEVVVYDEYGPVRMIRTPEWKYVHRHPYGPHELYDMVHDADERKNLVDDKSKQGLISEMRMRLARWFEKYVLPRMDGSRLPVYGEGQNRRIDADCCGDNAFQPRAAS